MKPLRLHYFALALVIAAAPAIAQQVISAKSGLLSYAEGQVTLNDEPVDFSGVHFSDVKENAIIRTADGRAELLLTPGVVLRMGENTSLRMITNRLVDTRLEILTGSAVVEADQIAKDTSVTIVCKEGVVTLPKAGLYRFDTEPARLKVFKGEAEVEFAGDTKTISTGRMMTLGGQTASIEKFDTEDTDSLDRWSHRRGSYLAMANTSAANSLMNSGGGYGAYGAGGYGLGGYGMAGWGMRGCSSAWAYNMYYNMMTYMPCYGSLWSPYGYRLYSPYSIYSYSGYAPPIYGGGASRTGSTGSGSASLARPAASASNRANQPAVGVGTSRGGLSSGGGRVGSTASSVPSSGNSGFSSASSGYSGGGSGGFSGGGSGGGGFSGSAGGGAAGGGGHAGGGGGSAGGRK